MTPEEFNSKYERNTWPFAGMNINEVVEITDYQGKDWKQVRAYAHVYGKKSGKKFSTLKEGESLFVKRDK